MFFLSSISAFCLFNSREGNSTLLKKRPLPFYGTLVDMWRCISDTRRCCDPISASGNGHFSHFRRLVQSFDGAVVFTPSQAEHGAHLLLHVLLADVDDKHEEAPQQDEAVDDPEEDLEVVGVVAKSIRVVGVQDVVDGREHPEDPKDQEQLGVQNL